VLLRFDGQAGSLDADTRPFLGPAAIVVDCAAPTLFRATLAGHITTLTRAAVVTTWRSVRGATATSVHTVAGAALAIVFADLVFFETLTDTIETDPVAAIVVFSAFLRDPDASLATPFDANPFADLAAASAVVGIVALHQTAFAAATRIPHWADLATTPTVELIRLKAGAACVALNLGLGAAAGSAVIAKAVAAGDMLGAVSARFVLTVVGIRIRRGIPLLTNDCEQSRPDCFQDVSSRAVRGPSFGEVVEVLTLHGVPLNQCNAGRTRAPC
jgi:hypothetical protein